MNLRIYIVIGLLLAANGCGKKVIMPSPVFILQYDIGSSSYSGYSEYKIGNSNFQLEPGRTIAYSNDPLSDSVLMHYNSILQDKNNTPLVAISIEKYFLKTQMDSIDGILVPKNDADFYDIFKTGNLNISNLQNREGVDIIVNTSLTTYVFNGISGFTPPTPAHLDTFNHFEITESYYMTADGVPVDWARLITENIEPQGSARRIMVKFNFKCKLYDTNAPHDSVLVTNGVFQGFFADR